MYSVVEGEGEGDEGGGEGDGGVVVWTCGGDRAKANGGANVTLLLLLFAVLHVLLRILLISATCSMVA